MIGSHPMKNVMMLAAFASAVAGIPAHAQIYDPQAEEAGPTSTTTGQANVRTTRRSSATTSSDASIDQVQAGSSQDRYVPDQVEGEDYPLAIDRDRREDPLLSDPRRQGNTSRIIREAEPSEFEVFVSQVADKKLRRFGAELLVPSARDFTAPADTLVPLDYRMNAGDVLIIGLTGSVEADRLKLTVDSEGNIFIPRIGRVRVGGVRYADLQSTISAQVQRQYRGFQLSVGIDRLHGITVYVTGFANVPGSYTVSSLSTLVNAVFASGGPSSGGSFRSIQLRRNGRLVADFDLYDLLLKGDKSADALLQNGDVIFIAPVGAQVAVIGSANNEAIFEARPGDKLTDILRYAGGVSTTGDVTRLLALDPLDLEAGWQQLTAAEANSEPAKRAQIVRIASNIGIARPLFRQNAFVTVSGEVARPGRYFVPPGTSMAAIIEQAGGLTPDAYVYGTVFTRESLRLSERDSFERAISEIEYLLTAAPLTSALSTAEDVSRATQLRSVIEQLRQREPTGRMILDVTPDTKTVPGDVVLENNDIVYVPSVAQTVGVFGSVHGAGSFRYRPGMTIRDFLAEAGGVQKLGDRGQTFVVRANGQVVGRQRKLFGGSVLDQKAYPGDLIFVPINPSRGEIWARLSALTSTLFSGAVTAAAVVAASK